MPVINALGRMTPRKSSNNPRNGKAGLTTCRRHSNSPAPQSPTEPVPISSNREPNRACPYLLDLCGVPSERVGCSFSIPGVPPRAGIGVGMAVADHPSLRTGLADFPHPALQSVSHPLVAGLVRLARAKAYREISPSFSKNALG